MCLSRSDNQNLVYNLSRSQYRSRYESIEFTKKSNLRRIQQPYVNNATVAECELKTPITELLHRDCIVCHLHQKIEKYNPVNDKKAAVISTLGCLVAICTVVALLIVAISVPAVIFSPISIAILSIVCVLGMSSALLGVGVLANRYLLKKEEAEVDVSIIMANLLGGILSNIDMPSGIQNTEILQTNKKDLDRLIREDQCAGTISKLRKLYHNLDSLDKQQEQLRVRIDSEVNSKKKETYNKKLNENSTKIEIKCKAVKALSEILYTRIFSGLEDMCHQDYKEEFIKNKYQYILNLTSSETFSANLHAMIFVEQHTDQETIARFQSSGFFKALLSGVSLIEEKNLFMSIN